MGWVFEYVFQLNVPNWKIDPFVADPIEAKVEIQENSIDLVADGDRKVNFLKGGQENHRQSLITFGRK